VVNFALLREVVLVLFFEFVELAMSLGKLFLQLAVIVLLLDELLVG
jgi:hypothetical protein